MVDPISIKFVEQAAYLTDNSENGENGQPGYVISVWYEEN